MGAKCIRVSTGLFTDIAAAEWIEYASIRDLFCELEATEHPKGFADLVTDISAFIPRKDLKLFVDAEFPADTEGPKVIPQTYPLSGAGGVGIYGPIFIVVEDLITGIDLNTLELVINLVKYIYTSPEVTCLPMDAPYKYVVRFVPTVPWSLGSTVSVSMSVKDRAGNPGLVEATC